MSEPHTFPVAWVRWIDSALRHGQYNQTELRDFKPVEMESVGWLIRETPDHIVIALEIFPADADIRSACVIPRECIREARKIMAPADWYAPERDPEGEKVVFEGSWDGATAARRELLNAGIEADLSPVDGTASRDGRWQVRLNSTDDAQRARDRLRSGPLWDSSLPRVAEQMAADIRSRYSDDGALCWHARPNEKFCGKTRSQHEGEDHEFVTAQQWADAHPDMFANRPPEHPNAEIVPGSLGDGDNLGKSLDLAARANPRGA